MPSLSYVFVCLSHLDFIHNAKHLLIIHSELRRMLMDRHTLSHTHTWYLAFSELINMRGFLLMSSFIWCGSAWMFSVGVRRSTRTHREKTDSHAIIYTSVPMSELMLSFYICTGLYLTQISHMPSEDSLILLWCFCFLKSYCRLWYLVKAEPNVCDWSILSPLYCLRVSVFYLGLWFARGKV